MKLLLDQMSLAQLRKLKVGDRLILHWQTAPNTIQHPKNVNVIDNFIGDDDDYYN